MEKKVIQTREDLDAIQGTEDHSKFLQFLKGSMTKKMNLAEYPEDYDNNLTEGDEGYVAPNWVDVETLDTINRFGYTKEEILTLTQD